MRQVVERLDLQEKFINALYARVPKKTDLENRIADLLEIEKDAAYRRVSGKVNFSIYELGSLANEFNISLDSLLQQDAERLWIPFILESPAKQRSIEALCDKIDLYLDSLKILTNDPTENGNIFNSVPIEFFVYYPTLMKFMFFKWGHYFVGTEEFNDFSNWEVPPRLTDLHKRIPESCKYEKSYYIWDSSLIWALAWEINSFRQMHIITEEDSQAIKQDLKDLLGSLERFLNGTYIPEIALVPDMDFYVSTINMGFTSSYYASAKSYITAFHTSFSFASVDNCYDSFRKMKQWIDSLKSISTKISKSGRIERRLFFETQYKTMDYILG